MSCDCVHPISCMERDCSCQCHPRNVPNIRKVVLEFNFREGVVKVEVARDETPRLLTLVPHKFKPHVMAAALAAAEKLYG